MKTWCSGERLAAGAPEESGAKAERLGLGRQTLVSEACKRYRIWES